jgi:drug/metabolite transporter (DMT)-like permease
VKSTSRDFWPVLAAATGSTMVGSVPMLAMGLYSRGMDPSSMLFWRYWLALSILVPLAIATSPGLSAEWRSAGRGLFINGITLGVLQTFTYFRAIQTMPSSIVVTIFFTYPLFTVIIDQIVFGRRARLPTILAVLLILLGVAFTGWPHLTLHEVEPIGLICAILTPLIFSVYIAIAFRFTRQSSPFASATFIYLGLGCGFTLIVLALGLKMPGDWGGWMRLAAIATVGGALQISSFAYALPRLSASGYSIIVSLELVTVTILGVAVLGEDLTAVQSIGIALVVIGIIVERLLRRKD